MATPEQIEWMAEKICSKVPAERYSDFLHTIKHDPNHLIQGLTEDIDSLIASYAMEGHERQIILYVASSDLDPLVTCAKEIVAFLQDDYLVEDLETIA